MNHMPAPRRHHLVGLLSLVLALAAPSPARAQAPSPTAQVAAMKRLDYMVGTWEGEGWMDIYGGRRSFRGEERVERKLDGVALLVQGRFLAGVGGANQVPVHASLAVISYDPGAQKYAFDTWIATGTSGKREMTLHPDGWEWRIQGPQGHTRYRMRLTPQGEWHEVGERSTDGERWNKFFEMTLRKVS